VAAKRPSAKPNTWLLVATALVGVVGVMLAFWPTTYLGPCPFLVRNKLPFMGGWGYDAAAGGTYNERGLREFTPEELALYDGTEGRPIMLGMNGDVFDVTAKGAQFYGPGQAYSVFAARDSTRALTKGSLEDEDVERGGDISDFDEARCKALADQHEFYTTKYGPRVGVIKYETPTHNPCITGAAGTKAPAAG
jgi:predicted heme/steroid binding protein